MLVTELLLKWYSDAIMFFSSTYGNGNWRKCDFMIRASGYETILKLVIKKSTLSYIEDPCSGNRAGQTTDTFSTSFANNMSSFIPSYMNPIWILLEQAKGPSCFASCSPQWPGGCLWETHKKERKVYASPATLPPQLVFRGILPLNLEVSYSHHD